MAGNGKPLRFAALRRVSTERQEKVGESLHTQKTQMASDVEHLHGKIVGWYGGQEHATPGHEKQEVDRLLADATKGKFDAVIVAHADRWSRDNAKSKAGIRILKENKIRFFVRTFEYDLFNPTQTFHLGMSAEIGELNAATQTKKSIENRIERAKKGIPTGGKLPFGRTFNKDTEKWGVDPEKKAMVVDVARRYLAGESMESLAKEYGINHANLHKIIMHRCGTEWSIRFDVDELNIHEVVPFTIPRLLPDSTIKKLNAKAAESKKYSHGLTKYKYLLSGMVLCDHCGYAMMGQTNHSPRKKQKQYYRHARGRRAKPCDCEKTWVDAITIEENVMRQLFDIFGNPQAVEKAIDEATPNRERLKELYEQQTRLEASLAKIEKGRGQIVKLIFDGKLSEDEVEGQMAPIRKQESLQKDKLREIKDQLENVPSPDAVRAIAADVAERFTKALFPTRRGNRKIGLVEERDGRLNASLWMKVEAADEEFHKMTWDEKRALVKAVFGGVTADGKRMGVYIQWKSRKGERPTWTYSIRGQIKQERLRPHSKERLHEMYEENPGVAQYASH